jgi:hypothetical protein
VDTARYAPVFFYAPAERKVTLPESILLPCLHKGNDSHHGGHHSYTSQKYRQNRQLARTRLQDVTNFTQCCIIILFHRSLFQL